MTRVRNALMDAASVVLFQINPGWAGTFDAWCDRWRWS